MIVKLSAEELALVGAKDATDFNAKFAAFVSAAKQMESVMADQPTIASLVSRIDDLEKLPQGATEARVKELITAESVVPIRTFLSTDEGKRIIGAESSRITMEALAAVSTSPNKPSPAAATPAAADVSALEASGEYEKAFPMLPAETRADFADAKSYAAFAKANRKGAVLINQKN